ncbi:glycosyltransferase family 2 protein [Deinococcus sp. 14RED07]|uniref:glycosyltransferase family 2 protein n=1 Tax=Deinococcus sp. 14RED07 TaxID=2745874 RepID=UPI001E647F57|nr:glycosyltransferase family 2 protein [Deinococcus sp. 14RED07]MCD0174724.1 glycosyltransferase family 2 protein [Deinococcus sp. 14RED07]
MKIETSFPKVSIIVVNWNGKNFLSDCLGSLKEQVYKNFELIVVDNGSTDGSQDEIRELYPTAILVELDSNLGFDEGNIVGYLRSSGDYVVLLNNDTKAPPEWLENLVAFADANTGFGIVGSIMLRWGSEIVDTAGDGCTLAGVGFKMHSGKKYSELPEFIDAFGACAGAALYRRSMIEEIGFLDSAFFMNLEDVDISYRARLAGYGVGICKESFVFHHVSSSVKKVSYLGNFYASRNVELVWWKNTPARYMPLSILEKMIHLTISTTASLLNREKLFSHISGKISAAYMILTGQVNRSKIQKLYRGNSIRFTTEISRIGAKAIRK